MRVRYKDFRCFHVPDKVELRPINLLVGENSAGKTSFMAATRFLFEMFRRGVQPSFNKDPFHLGSFDQIAHYRGGRFGRAKTFSLEIEGIVPKSEPHRRQRELFPDDATSRSGGEYSLSIGFRDYKSQPVLDTVDFTSGLFRFNVAFKSGLSFVISTPSTRDFAISEFLSEEIEPTQIALSYIEFLLRDLRFMVGSEASLEKKKEGLHSGLASPPAHFFDEVRQLSDIYRRVLKALPEEVYASSPVRSKPERTYNLADFSQSPDGAHIPFVLAQMKYFDTKKSEEIEKELSAFGRSSGLFDRVQIKPIGKGPSSPFQIIVSLPNRKSNIIDVGYGVSQALPIAADLLRMKSTTFLFQQPEVHLHPKAQAELGSFFVRVAKQRNHTLLVETHSDYLIDRIRMEVRKGQFVSPSDVSLLYFSRRDHDVDIHQIHFDSQGNVVGAPDGYRQFFLQEELRSLGLNEL